MLFSSNTDKFSMLRLPRAPHRRQIRLNRRDLSLVYRYNQSLLYAKLKFTSNELTALTSIGSSEFRDGDVPHKIQCAIGLSYLTTNGHQTWLAEAVGVSQASASRYFHIVVTIFSSDQAIAACIKYPTTAAQRAALSLGFQRACNLPSTL